MRNIKNPLRFVRNSALLLAAATGMSYLTACQSEQGIDPSPENPIPETSLKTAAYSVYGANQSRVRNYGGASTRAGEYVEAAKSFDMPESVVVPEGIAEIYDIPSTEGYKVQQGVDYLIPAGKTLNCGFAATATYYVAGTMSLENGLWSVSEGATIIVLPGGTLDMNSTIQPGLTIYNYGNLVSASGITVGEGVKLYSAVDIDGISSFSVNGGEGKVPGEFYSRASVMADDFVRLNGNVAACAFIAKTIDIHETGRVKASYFKSDALSMNKGYVELDNNGLVDVKKMSITNNETRFVVNGTNAVVYATEFNCSHHTHIPPVFAAEIACRFDKCLEAGVSIGMNDLGLQKYSEDMVVYVPAAGCHGSFSYNPETGEIKRDETDPEPPVVDPDKPITEIKKITDIESLDEEINHGDHDHGIISATCITFGNDGTAYASYHLRGAGTGDHNQPNYVGEYAQKGCIEVIKDNGNGMELGSYMIAPDWDFNHLIVDGNRIVTVGNAKTMSAFIGTLPTSFEASVGTDRDDFQVRELTTNEPIYGTSDKTGEQIRIGFKNAGDGNCVVRQGNYYYVATYEGYGPLNLDFSRVNDADGNKIFKSTNGSCKHISINGSNMAVLAHDTYDKIKSPASVYTFDASDYSFSNVKNTFAAFGEIEPVDGKNVIAVDGNEVYACLSKGGLVRLSDGKKFQRGTNGNVPVNGMAFDDNYIYVANGSFVSVLDKATMEEICYYHAASQKSANYIALRNGKIYVAFGEDGIQVFQLVQKEIKK